MTWDAPKVKHHMTTCSIDMVGGLRKKYSLMDVEPPWQ